MLEKGIPGRGAEMIQVRSGEIKATLENNIKDSLQVGKVD